MARLIAEPKAVTLTRPRIKRTIPAARPAIPSTASQTVLGDRVGGARPQTKVVRRSNRPVAREMAVVLVASFVVSLLCFYVSAYARVTAEGFELARLTQKMQKAEAREEALKAAIAGQSDMETIAHKAATMGLVPGETAALNLVTTKVSVPVPAPASDTLGTGAIVVEEPAPKSPETTKQESDKTR